MEAVRFKNGKYGVRRSWQLRTYEFLSISDDRWWADPRHVQEYCLFPTKKSACVAMRKVRNRTIKDNGTPVTCGEH